MSRWYSAVVAAANILRVVWGVCQLLAFCLVYQGYGSTHCGGGYVVTRVELFAIDFLRVVSFPVLLLPAWVCSAPEPVFKAIHLMVGGDLTAAYMTIPLVLNHQLGAGVSRLAAAVAHRRMACSGILAPLPATAKVP